MNRRPFFKEEHNNVADLFHGLATLFNSVTAPALNRLGVGVSKDIYFCEHRPQTTKAYREKRRIRNRMAAASRRANR